MKKNKGKIDIFGNVTVASLIDIAKKSVELIVEGDTDGAAKWLEDMIEADEINVSDLSKGGILVSMKPLNSNYKVTMHLGSNFERMSVTYRGYGVKSFHFNIPEETSDVRVIEALGFLMGRVLPISLDY